MSDQANGHPRDLLSEYLDDALDLEARASIDRHLAACDDCREHLEALRRLVRAVADESVPPVPVDLSARIGRSLDAARRKRRARSRFMIPATVAATVGAIGILVALNWRQGRFAPPAAPERLQERQVLDEAAPSNAPSSPAVSEKAAVPREDKKEDARREADEKGLAKTAEPSSKESAKQKDAGGVDGGVSGLGASGGDYRVSGGAERDAPADDELRNRAVSSKSNALARAAQEPAPSRPLAQDAAPSPPLAPASAPAAKAEAPVPCDEHWSDSGVRGTWEVTDAASAARELDQIARDVSGLGRWRGIADGRPYVLVVPRARFDEVFYALRARGITGLDRPPELAPGSGCAGMSVAFEIVAPAAPPPPR